MKKDVVVTLCPPARAAGDKIRAKKKAKQRRAKKRTFGMTSKEFYKSDEWLRLRYKVLKRYAGKCMACGASGHDTQLHVDHIQPRSKFPELALSEGNLQVLCHDCNLGKGAWDMTDWRPELDEDFLRSMAKSN